MVRYSDVDWAGAIEDNKSTIGYYRRSTSLRVGTARRSRGIRLHGEAKTQFVVAQSNVEDENIAIA